MISTMKRITKLEVNDKFEENVKRVFNSRYNVIVEVKTINPMCKEYRVFEDVENPNIILITVHDNKVKDLILVNKS